MKSTDKAETGIMESTVQEREYRRLYLNACAARDELKGAIATAIVQLESGVMAEQVAQQLKRAV